MDESNPEVDSMNKQNGTRRRYKVRRLGLFHHFTWSCATRFRMMLSSMRATGGAMVTECWVFTERGDVGGEGAGWRGRTVSWGAWWIHLLGVVQAGRYTCVRQIVGCYIRRANAGRCYAPLPSLGSEGLVIIRSTVGRALSTSQITSIEFCILALLNCYDKYLLDSRRV